MKLTGTYTAAGAAMAASALANGQSFTVTRAAAGSGETALDASMLSQIRQDLQITGKRALNGSCIIETVLEATDAQSDYMLREIGLYARLGGGQEQLYKIFRLSEGLKIESAVDLSITFLLRETVLAENEVELVISREGSVTAAECRSLIAESEERTAQAVSDHISAESAHSALFAAKAAAVHTHQPSDIASGAFGGSMTVPADTDCETAKLRNIVLSASAPTGGRNGEIWLRYAEA